MSITSRKNYLWRIFTAYLTKRKSHLTFWHEVPDINDQAFKEKLGQYYMTFYKKADYAGFFDEKGIPLLDYHGTVGKQYNPIAIAQYGIGNFNLFKKNGDLKRLEIAIKQADWLVENLEKNKNGIFVWMHYFDWEYRDLLESPWYSSLAQGSGLSLLVRIYKETNQQKYFDAAKLAFQSFLFDIENGGVTFIDKEGFYWLEETIVNPPTHILNGVMWSLWGVYDYLILTNDQQAKKIFDECVKTLKKKLHKFDIGFWSLYEQAGLRLHMIASPFYHRLHIVQLRVMYNLTGDNIFKEYADRWSAYQERILFKLAAIIYKSFFKILYY